MTEFWDDQRSRLPSPKAERLLRRMFGEEAFVRRDSPELKPDFETYGRVLEERDVGQAPVADDLTDAKIAAAEARTDAKLASFQGQFEVLSMKLDNIAGSLKEQRVEATGNRNNVVTTVIAVGFTLAALLIAVMAYGDAIFSRGMSVRDVVETTVHDLANKAPRP